MNIKNFNNFLNESVMNTKTYDGYILSKSGEHLDLDFVNMREQIIYDLSSLNTFMLMFERKLFDGSENIVIFKKQEDNMWKTDGVVYHTNIENTEYKNNKDLLLMSDNKNGITYNNFFNDVTKGRLIAMVMDCKQSRLEKIIA